MLLEESYVLGWVQDSRVKEETASGDRDNWPHLATLRPRCYTALFRDPDCLAILITAMVG